MEIGGNKRCEAVPGLVLRHGCQHGGHPGKADLAGSKPSKQSTGPAKRWKLTRLAFRELRKGLLKRQDGQPTSRPRWETPGAASEFPSDPDLVDEEEQDTVSPPEEETILPSAPPPWRGTSHASRERLPD
jgi:hypothetical protein